MNCHHKDNKGKSQKSLLNKNNIEIAQKKRKLLECKLFFVKNSLKQYAQLEKECIANNFKIIQNVENDEFLSHEQIKILLKKFERLKVTALNLNSKYNDKSELGNIMVNNDQLSMQLQLDKINSQISEIDLKIMYATQEKEYLQNYFETHYNNKCDQIEQCKKELDVVCAKNENNLISLKNFLKDKVNHIIDEKNRIIKDKTNQTIDKYLNTDKDIKNVFLENWQLEKLIISYTDLYKIMENEIKCLKNENSTKQNIKLRTPRKKCLPDETVELQIEKITNLPI